MKLQEILRIVSQPVPGFDLSSIKDFKHVKDNYLTDFTIYKGSVDDQLVFVVKLDDKIIGTLVAVNVDDLELPSKKKVLIIKRTWCDRKFRNKGIISNLYRFVYNELKYALISDIEQSPESVQIWDRLRSAWDVKMINLKTKEISKIDTTELYGNSDYALFVESYSTERFKGIIKDHIFEMTGY